MPWNRNNIPPAEAARERGPLARNAKLPDVYSEVRHLRVLLAGIASSVANTALAATRNREASDANREQLIKLSQDIRTLIGSVDQMTLEMRNLVEVTKP